MHKKTRKTAEKATPDLLERIKITTITSLFADDELLELFVLKGGNAMSIIYGVNARASADIDISVEPGFVYSQKWPIIENALITGFREIGYMVFDARMNPRPGKQSEELNSFWCGYLISFKLISLTRALECNEDIETMRREAVQLGTGTQFTVDVSRYEYTTGKEVHELDNYTVYVYSPEMIICEKLRALCQQMPEYGEIIKNKSLGNQRARDFFDIEALIIKFKINLGDERIQNIVKMMFEAKKVPLNLLNKIHETKSFHEIGYDEVRATMDPGTEIRPFEYYFNFVTTEIRKIKIP